MRLLPLMALLAVAACGSPAAVSAPTKVAPAAPAHEGGPAVALDHVLARSRVHAAVLDGLGVFLQHVDVDDHPVMAGGRFHGFRIAALRDADFWAGVDLKPGDVVTAVNGFPIERPEQAQTALESLDVSSELRVAYERDGQARELVYAIDDAR